MSNQTKQLTLVEALNILETATKNIQATRDQHFLILQALETLKEHCKKDILNQK